MDKLRAIEGFGGGGGSAKQVYVAGNFSHSSGSNRFMALSNDLTAATEGPTQMRMPLAGKINYLNIHLDVNTDPTNRTYLIRLNGADSALTVEVTGSTAGDYNETTEVTFAVGDLITIQVPGTTNVHQGTVQVGVEYS